MDTGIKISIIVAMEKRTHAIGRNGDMPWYLSDDLKRFKKLTTGRIAIVGRKTQESIRKRLGGPLPNRRTIVLTKQQNWRAGEELVAHSWKEVLMLAHGEDEIFVIGGAEIYNLALPYTDIIYLTLVYSHIDGDSHFPNFNALNWDWSEYRHHSLVDERNEYPFSWWTLRRIKSEMQNNPK